jgi:cyclohexanecarboxylate-CoA ligase
MTASGFDALAHARAMRASGWWVDKTVDAMFAEAMARFPDKPALVAYRADRETPPNRFSYRELAKLVARATAGLRALGVGRGDVVAIQLPNWWEFVVATLACARLGAVVNPLMPIFRERELRFMLDFSAAKVFIAPKLFRDFDHAEMGRSLKASVPSLAHVVAVDGEGEGGFEALLRRGEGHEVGPDASQAQPADRMSVLMFTSGTTGEPKGVMHSDNTLVACADALAARFKLDADEVLLCCAPLGHMTGFAAVMLQSVRLGATLVLQDVWDSKRAVKILAEEGITYTAASTPFLSDICDGVAAGGPRPQRLKKFLCGGAPIPPVLIERAARELGLQVSSLWGMTESLGSTLTEPERAAEKSASTDGRALEGVAVRVVDDAGQVLPSGQTGRLEVRGAQMFLGYFKRPDIKTFGADGWFDTGDLAYMDAEGYIRINGRTKDVLIRGGENVPVFEIESLLHRHPAVLAAAIVGYPDERLGERGCAFLVLRPGTTLDLGGVQAWMAECKVAKQYWPERVEVLPDLPRTPSGKIQKFVLRARAKAFDET